MGNLRKVKQGVQKNQQGAPDPMEEAQGQGDPMMGQEGGLVQDAQALAMGEGDVDPKLKASMEDYTAVLMNVIHSPETNGSVVEMLSGGPAQESIPFTANQVNDMVLQSIAKKQGAKKPEDAVLMAGAIYLVTDLAELGNAADVFEQPVGEQDMAPLLQKTMQSYIQKGLKDGTIDPVQLQTDTEPYLNEEQRGVGLMMGNELGQPTEPTAGMANDQIVQKKVAPLEKENAALKQKSGALQKAQGQAAVGQGQQVAAAVQGGA